MRISTKVDGTNEMVTYGKDGKGLSRSGCLWFIRQVQRAQQLIGNKVRGGERGAEREHPKARQGRTGRGKKGSVERPRFYMVDARCNTCRDEHGPTATLRFLAFYTRSPLKTRRRSFYLSLCNRRKRSRRCPQDLVCFKSCPVFLDLLSNSAFSSASGRSSSAFPSSGTAPSSPGSLSRKSPKVPIVQTCFHLEPDPFAPEAPSAFLVFVALQQDFKPPLYRPFFFNALIHAKQSMLISVQCFGPKLIVEHCI